MRVILAFLLSAPLVAHSGDRLTGAWRSDHDASIEFAHEHSILEPRQADFLQGILGRLELTFDGKNMRYLMPDTDVSIQGKAQHFVGSDDKFAYRVLGTTVDSVALVIAKHYGHDRIWHLHFVNDNVFWIYSEDGDYGLRDLNFREYFRRLQ